MLFRDWLVGCRMIRAAVTARAPYMKRPPGEAKGCCGARDRKARRANGLKVEMPEKMR